MLDRYVVNLSTSGLNLSVWSGDIRLRNLELNVDTIEHELNIPVISLMSSKIHELVVHIPWTKITSEPVEVTVNSMELIITTRFDEHKEEDACIDCNDDDSDDDDDNGEVDDDYTDGCNGRRRRHHHRRTSVQTDLWRQPDQPSWVRSLLSKIKNNVTFRINNFMLKFIQDDVVLSVSMKLLDIHSVDRRWYKKFTDLAAIPYVLQKLVEVTDMTVCLDRKSHISGTVEHFQAPILYRMSLLGGLRFMFVGGDAILPTESQFDIYCDSFIATLSDEQLSMLLVVVDALSKAVPPSASSCEHRRDDAFVKSNLVSRNSISPQSPVSTVVQGDSLTNSSLSEANSASGWRKWLWNQFVSGDYDMIVDSPELPPARFGFGLYIKSAQITCTAITTASSLATSPIYIPVLRIDLDGISTEIIIDDFRKSRINVDPIFLFGITYVAVFMKQGTSVSLSNSISRCVARCGKQLANPLRGPVIGNFQPRHCQQVVQNVSETPSSRCIGKPTAAAFLEWEQHQAQMAAEAAAGASLENSASNFNVTPTRSIIIGAMYPPLSTFDDELYNEQSAIIDCSPRPLGAVDVDSSALSTNNPVDGYLRGSLFDEAVSMFAYFPEANYSNLTGKVLSVLVSDPIEVSLARQRFGALVVTREPRQNAFIHHVDIGETVFIMDRDVVDALVLFFYGNVPLSALSSHQKYDSRKNESTDARVLSPPVDIDLLYKLPRRRLHILWGPVRAFIHPLVNGDINSPKRPSYHTDSSVVIPEIVIRRIEFLSSRLCSTDLAYSRKVLARYQSHCQYKNIRNDILDSTLVLDAVGIQVCLIKTSGCVDLVFDVASTCHVIVPEFDTSVEVHRQEQEDIRINVELPQLTATVTRPEFLLMTMVIESWLQTYTMDIFHDIALLSHDILSASSPPVRLVCDIINFIIEVGIVHNGRWFTGSLGSLHLFSSRVGQCNSLLVCGSLPRKSENVMDSLVHFEVQIPCFSTVHFSASGIDSSLKPVLIFTLGSMEILGNSELYDWLTYRMSTDEHERVHVVEHVDRVVCMSTKRKVSQLPMQCAHIPLVRFLESAVVRISVAPITFLFATGNVPVMSPTNISNRFGLNNCSERGVSSEVRIDSLECSVLLIHLPGLTLAPANDSDASIISTNTSFSYPFESRTEPSTLPWVLKMHGLRAHFIESSGVISSLLVDLSVDITITVTNAPLPGICLHVSVYPVSVGLSKVQLHLIGTLIDIAHDCLIGMLYRRNHLTNLTSEEHDAEVVSLLSSIPDESSSFTVVSTHSLNLQWYTDMTLWVQCTVPRVSLAVVGETSDSLVNLLLEECSASVNVEEGFLICDMKISTAAVYYSMLNDNISDNSKWIPVFGDGALLSSSRDNSLPFLTATCRHGFDKTLSDDITIVVQPFVCVLWGPALSVLTYTTILALDIVRLASMRARSKSAQRSYGGRWFSQTRYHDDVHVPALSPRIPKINLRVGQFRIVFPDGCPVPDNMTLKSCSNVFVDSSTVGVIQLQVIGISLSPPSFPPVSDIPSERENSFDNVQLRVSRVSIWSGTWRDGINDDAQIFPDVNPALEFHIAGREVILEEINVDIIISPYGLEAAVIGFVNVSFTNEQLALLARVYFRNLYCLRSVSLSRFFGHRHDNIAQTLSSTTSPHSVEFLFAIHEEVVVCLPGFVRIVVESPTLCVILRRPVSLSLSFLAINIISHDGDAILSTLYDPPSRRSGLTSPLMIVHIKDSQVDVFLRRPIHCSFRMALMEQLSDYLRLFLTEVRSAPMNPKRYIDNDLLHVYSFALQLKAHKPISISFIDSDSDNSLTAKVFGIDMSHRKLALLSSSLSVNEVPVILPCDINLLWVGCAIDIVVDYCAVQLRQQNIHVIEAFIRNVLSSRVGKNLLAFSSQFSSLSPSDKTISTATINDLGNETMTDTAVSNSENVGVNIGCVTFSSEAMAWSFSLPRHILRITSYPIPFISPIGCFNDTDILCLCTLYRYEELSGSWINELLFELVSDRMVTYEVPRDLPASSRWEVRMSKAVVSPMSLFLALRVDSCAQMFSLSCNLDRLEVDLYHDRFNVVSLSANHLIANIVPPNFSRIRCDTSIDVLNICDLSRQRFINISDLCIGIDAKSHDVKVATSMIEFEVGRSASLLITRYPYTETSFLLYTVVNQTQVALDFGQVGTDEVLTLLPEATVPYAWRSHTLSPLIQFRLHSMWSVAVDISSSTAKAIFDGAIVVEVITCKQGGIRISIRGNHFLTSRLDINVFCYVEPGGCSIAIPAGSTVPLLIDSNSCISFSLNAEGTRNVHTRSCTVVFGSATLIEFGGVAFWIDSRGILLPPFLLRNRLSCIIHSRINVSNNKHTNLLHQLSLNADSSVMVLDISPWDWHHICFSLEPGENWSLPPVPMSAQLSPVIINSSATVTLQSLHVYSRNVRIGHANLFIEATRASPFCPALV